MHHHIEVISHADSASKEKGDLLETLATDLLFRQSYEVETQVRVTAAELDLLCKHKVNGKQLYVECKAHRETLGAPALMNILGKQQLHDYDECWLISAGPLGKDAKGFKVDWEKKPPKKRQLLNIYDPVRIIEAFCSAQMICEPPAQACGDFLPDTVERGDWTLLISSGLSQ